MDPALHLELPPATTARGGPQDVLFVEASPGFGGSLVYLGRLLGALDRDRFRPHVVTFRPSQTEYLKDTVPGLDAFDTPLPTVEPDEGVGRLLGHAAAPPGRVGDRLLGAARYLCNRHVPVRRAARRIRRRLADVPMRAVWLNNVLLAHRGVGFALADAWDIPVVARIQDCEQVSPVYAGEARRVALFLPDSRSCAEPLRQMAVPADRIHVNYYPIDADAFDPDLVRTTGIPHGLLGRDPGLTFGVVGVLLSWKGQDVFLEAAARVLARVPGSTAVVVGDSPAGAGGPLEPVIDGVTGSHAIPGDPHCYAEAIVRLLRDPDLRASFGRRGRESVIERFGLADHVAGTQSLLDAVLAEAAASAAT